MILLKFFTELHYQQKLHLVLKLHWKMKRTVIIPILKKVENPLFEDGFSIKTFKHLHKNKTSLKGLTWCK